MVQYSKRLIKLKLVVFVPMRKHLGAPAGVAAIATFIASGLFHEYQFKLSFASYQIGTVSFFFFLHGLLSFADAMYCKAFGKIGLISLGAPPVVQSVAILVLFSPTVPYFTQTRIDAGMFDVMSLISPQIKYQ